MIQQKPCPSCGQKCLEIFYQVDQIPVHSVLLMKSRDEAVSYPNGDIRLAVCKHCSFITNIVFDPDCNDYNENYEGTQSFSPTFNKFHRDLAQNLIDRYDLHGKKIVEIGCGQGEFLQLICEMGGNFGLGYDPAYRGEPRLVVGEGEVRFISELYDQDSLINDPADFVICKMTLEHIPDVGKFVQTVRQSIGDQRDTVVFFQIPDVSHVLKHLAFWDIYYEHCSYFSKGSLWHLFRSSGFDVLRLDRVYADQYLTIEARPAEIPWDGVEIPPEIRKEMLEVWRDVERFKKEIPEQVSAWRTLIINAKDSRQNVALWCGGSKTVAFLTTLGIHDEIPFAVDINPRKNGTFLPGNGQEVVAPDHLRQVPPDILILMNGIYRDEIQSFLHSIHQNPKILTIEKPINE